MIDISLVMRIIKKDGEDIDFEDKEKGSISIEKPKNYMFKISFGDFDSGNKIDKLQSLN